jgi:branched-chain amino acid transport system substrate-binding protein
LTEVVKPDTVAILHENSLFGTRGARYFRDMCRELDLKVLAVEGYEHGNLDFKPVLVRVKRLNPDIVYMISYIMDASLLMRQSRELKLSPKLFIGGAAGFTLPEFAQNAGKASEKVVSATLWHHVLPLPGALRFFNTFKARYNRSSDYHGAEAYAAAHVIADVLKRTRSFGAGDVKTALEQTDMMTVFGPVKFISYGKKSNQNRLHTYVVQWQDGTLNLIWPPELANADPVYPVNWLREWGY